MSEELFLRAVDLGRPAMLELGIDKNSCIAMSRLMVEICNYFHQPATAHRAMFMAMNPKFMELLDAGRIRLDEELPQWAEDEGAWSVGVGKPLPDGRDGLHVVVVAGDYLIDASLDQASRPAKNIHLKASVMPFDPKKNLVFEKEDGTTIWYDLTDDTKSFKSSRDWTDFNKRYGKVAAGVIRQLKKETVNVHS